MNEIKELNDADLFYTLSELKEVAPELTMKLADHIASRAKENELLREQVAKWADRYAVMDTGTDGGLKSFAEDEVE